MEESMIFEQLKNKEIYNKHVGGRMFHNKYWERVNEKIFIMFSNVRNK